MFILAFLLTVIIIIIKAYWDSENWGNVNHTVGIGLVSLILIPLCLYIQNPYPIFLYGLLFNLTINRIRKLPTFYIGNSSWTDKALRKIFPTNPGEAFALINLIAFLYFIT